MNSLNRKSWKTVSLHAAEWLKPRNSAIVWLDRSEADVLKLNLAHLHATVLYFKAEPADSGTPDGHARPHPAAGDGRAQNAPSHFPRIAQALTEAAEIIITGPAWEKWALISYLVKHHPDVAAKVVGFEHVDYPSSTHLLACARKYSLKALPFR